MSIMLSYICIAILAFVQIAAAQESYATVLAEQLNQYCALRDGSTGGPLLGTPRVGKAGPRGHPGAVGPRGPLGPTGPVGPIGNPGPVGKTGAVGPRGLPGPTGSVGPIGNSGPVGERGAAGPRGPTGLTGHIGNSGPVGEPGPPGTINYTKIEQMIVTTVRRMAAKDCSGVDSVLATSRNASGGVFDIYPPSYPEGTEVFCDTETDGGGWTLFQRRMDGSVDFNRNWNDYVNGFGSPTGEYWMGLEKLHRLTSDGNYELRVDLADWEQNKAYAKYSTFSVGDASDKYRLSISGYSGTAGDSFASGTNLDNMRFSTPDQDNDGSSFHCAQRYEGGGWFNNCMHVHLNGVYSQQSAISAWKGIIWYDWKRESYSLKFTEMKFRRKIS